MLYGVQHYIYFHGSAVHLHSSPPVSSPAASCVLWRSGVCGAEEGQPPGRLGVATQRPAWKALGQPWCLCLPVQSGHLIFPIHSSISPSASCLPVCLLQPLSRLYSRARPRWLLLREQRVSHLDHRRDWREAVGGQRGRQWPTRCILVKAKDWLNQSYFLPWKEHIPNRWTCAEFVIVVVTESF